MERHPLFVSCARSHSPTMVLGAFSLQHNAIASINDNDITDHKTLSILYEQYCKVCTCTYELSTEKTKTYNIEPDI